MAAKSTTEEWTPAPETVAWLASLPKPGGSGDTAPTSRRDWELVERYRLLVTDLTTLAQWENARLAQEKQEWDQRTAELAPHIAQLNLAASPALDDLAEAHGRLPLAVPSASTSALPTHYSLTSFVAALEEIESSISALNLEVAETRNLQQSLEEEAQKRLSSPSQPLSAEAAAATAKLEKAVTMLGRKSAEYQTRLEDLKKRVPIGFNETLGQLNDKATEYEQLQATRSDLKQKLASYGDLPSDYKKATRKIEAREDEVQRLRRKRDRLLSR